MQEKHFKHDALDQLGRKLDGLDLTDDERQFLAAVIDTASQRATADTKLSLSDRLHRVRGRLDAGASHVIV